MAAIQRPLAKRRARDRPSLVSSPAHTAPLRTLQFKTYVGIEVLIWFPGLYAACYTLQPTVRIVSTQLGARAVKASSEWLLQKAPKWHASIAKLSTRVYGGPHKRAFAEWVLLNKVLAPVSFPTKLWIAHKVVERQTVMPAEYMASLQPPAGSPLAGGMAGDAAAAASELAGGAACAVAEGAASVIDGQAATAKQ